MSHKAQLVLMYVLGVFSGVFLAFTLSLIYVRFGLY